MPKDKEALRREIEMLSRQTYEPLPRHEMIGRTLRMVSGDAQFFYPDARKVVQMVKRGSLDGELYYLVYGDGAYHADLFLVPADNFRDDVPEPEQKTLMGDVGDEPS